MYVFSDAVCIYLNYSKYYNIRVIVCQIFSGILFLYMYCSQRQFFILNLKKYMYILEHTIYKDRMARFSITKSQFIFSIM
jgi:hypothetical protein